MFTETIAIQTERFRISVPAARKELTSTLFPVFIQFIYCQSFTSVQRIAPIIL